MGTGQAGQAAVLGLRVLRAMQRRGLSIPQLAKQSGVALSGVQKIVAGKGKQVSVWTVSALADVLGMTLDDLTGRTSPQPQETTLDPPAPYVQEPPSTTCTCSPAVRQWYRPQGWVCAHCGKRAA